MIKAVLFDLDGTIVDSEAQAFLVIQKKCLEWGVRIKPTDAAVFAGKKWDFAFSYLCQTYDFPIEESELGQKILHAYHLSLQETISVVPGVVEAIKELSREYKMGLVSGSYRKDILYILQKLDVLKYFSIVLGSEDYPNSKPAPDGYRQAIDFFKLQPENCLVFEDSHPGIDSALAAGAYVVAVTLTNHFGHDLSKAHAQIKNFQKVNCAWIRDFGETRSGK